jgi:hypothetical protein
MGMFDQFTPIPALKCPFCGCVLERFQGQDGPCQLLTWEQGRATPWSMDSNEDASDLHDAVLPKQFGFYTDCAGCLRWLEFIGVSRDGVWRDVVVGDLVDSTCAAIPAHVIDDMHRECSQCRNVWVCSRRARFGRCPKCEAMTMIDAYAVLL